MLLAALALAGLCWPAGRARALPAPLPLPQYDSFSSVPYISGSDAQASTVEEESQPNGGDGNYSYRFSTSNGINHSEEGAFAPGAEPEQGNMEVTGAYSYVDPQGRTHSVTYTAGVGGYVAEGDDIPTPVPTQYPLPEVPQRQDDADGGGGGGGPTQGFSRFTR